MISSKDRELAPMSCVFIFPGAQENGMVSFVAIVGYYFKYEYIFFNLVSVMIQWAQRRIFLSKNTLAFKEKQKVYKKLEF